jgi:hypothetical protein
VLSFIEVTDREKNQMCCFRVKTENWMRRLEMLKLRRHWKE